MMRAFVCMLMLLSLVFVACDKPKEGTDTATPPTTETKPEEAKTEQPAAQEEEPKVELSAEEKGELKKEAAQAAEGITAENANEEADKLAKEIEAE